MKTNYQNNNIPVSQREFLRPAEVHLLFPCSRSYLYELLESGRVHSICVRKKGNHRGMRFVSVESLREYFKGFANKTEEVSFDLLAPTKGRGSL